MPHPVGPDEGGPHPSAWTRPRRPFGVVLGPAAPRMGLEVEGPELVVADDDVGVAALGLGLSVRDVVELEDPVLLHLEVGVVGGLPGLDGLKGDTLLAEKRPESLMADVVDHPLRTRWSANLVSDQVEKGSP